ncbi:MAG: ArsA family ATPase [Candidatus Binatus sp.]|uniref:ArsA family ATPase n=1 Tax=Candidatus Binatus sp. TaxID=2811406 RepID=UPI00271F521E|nr:ArsA family ATPase [Candidatus Binatus sp.]MDO8433883.1 ArsA family ATPase [Candidatus Binatus sp.]
MLTELLDCRVLIVLGKGGVGKTVLSAAIARLAAASGRRALIMETDAGAPLASTLGVEASFVPIDVAPNLSLMLLDGGHALEEYLRLVVPGRMLLKAVFASRVYQFFVQAAPGLRELMMLGKIYYEAERAPDDPNRHDLIIVDAPASGQALSMLKMPAAAHSTFGDSTVGKESRNISDLLHDRRRCAILQVTTSDSLSVSETIETYAELNRLGMPPSAIIYNRATPFRFDAGDISSLLGRMRAAGRHRDHLAELAEAERLSAGESRKAATRIRRATHAPLIEVAEHGGIDGLDLIERVASDLAALDSIAGSSRFRNARPAAL